MRHVNLRAVKFGRQVRERMPADGRTPAFACSCGGMSILNPTLSHISTYATCGLSVMDTCVGVGLVEKRGSVVFVERAGMSAFSWQARGSLVITPDVQPCGLHLSLAPSVFTSKADFLSLSDLNKGPFMQLCNLPNALRGEGVLVKGDILLVNQNQSERHCVPCVCVCAHTRARMCV